MMNEWLNISLLDWIIAGVLAVVFIYQMYFYGRYIGAVARKNRRDRKYPVPESGNLPGVSVIICARNEEQNLTDYLHAVLEQDYPLFEVIVVNDGSLDRTDAVLEEYRLKYPHLHVTFVPTEARVMSSKKLALTLAVKAAQYEYLLLTDADCRPESCLWIREMMKGVRSDATRLVLGYSPYFPSSDGVNQIIRYETLFNGLQYMGCTLAGHPYMGVGRNMMYRKSLFLEHKGFAGLLALRSGDDDLFVNKVATRANTAVVCAPASLSWSLPKSSCKEWVIQKRRHLAASSYYKPATRFMLGVEPVMRGLWYAALVIAFVFGGAWVGLLAWLLLVVRMAVQVGLVNRAARSLGEKTFGLEVVWYDMILPVMTAVLLSTQPRNQHTRW